MPRHFVYDKAVIHILKNSKQSPRCSMHRGLSIVLTLDKRQTPPTINIVGQKTCPSDPLLAHFSKKKTYFPQILSQIRD